MSDKTSQSLIQRIDQLIKKNNELEKKVFNLINNPEENTSKSFISKKEKELQNLQSQIQKKPPAKRRLFSFLLSIFPIFSKSLFE